LVVLAWFLAANIGYGGNLQTEGQRVFSCRSPRESMKAMVWAEAILFFMLLTLTLPVLGLLPLYPEMYMAEPAQREEAYGMLLRDFLPVGLLGLALAGLTASVMSTIDSHLNYGAQIMTNDVARVFNPSMTEKQGLLFGRLVTIVIIGASIVVVYYSKSLIDIAVTLLGLFGSTLAFAWGQWWWWRVNFRAWIAAMVFGPIIYLSLGPLLEFIPWWENYGAQSHSAQQVLGMLQAAMGMAISAVVWIVTALVTKPEEMSVLKDFYKEAHPMGLWGPVRRAIIEEEGAATLPPARLMIAPGLGVAMLGTTWISLGILSLSQLYVGFYSRGILMAVAAVLAAIAFRFAFSWYFKRLEETSGGA
jgi:solute:Na+ symporter, SSS family